MYYLPKRTKVPLFRVPALSSGSHPTEFDFPLLWSVSMLNSHPLGVSCLCAMHKVLGLFSCHYHVNINYTTWQCNEITEIEELIMSLALDGIGTNLLYDSSEKSKDFIEKLSR